MKRICIVLSLLVVFLTVLCVFYHDRAAQLNNVEMAIEAKNYQACFDFSVTLENGKYNELLVKQLGAMDAFSSLSTNWNWSVFPQWLSGLADEQTFNSIFKDDLTYISETIRDLISNPTFLYEDAYEKLFQFVYELGIL